MKTLTLDQLLHATSEAKNRLYAQVQNGLKIEHTFITVIILLGHTVHVKDGDKEKLVDTAELNYSYEKEGKCGYKITLRTPVIVNG